MTILEFEPFNKEELIERLKIEFPNYIIQTGLGGLQVRTSGFTVTGNVKININAKKGRITTQTNFDMVALFLIFFLPLGIYILTKKEKQQAMEKEIANKIKDILKPDEKNLSR